MNEQAKLWQADARRAFEWLIRMYERCKLAMDDAEAFFEDAGWSTQFGNGMGGVCISSVLSEWPFVYLRLFAALPPGMKDDAPTGHAALFGVLFHDDVRQGPTCIGARVDWNSGDAVCDHWMTFAALGGDGPNKDAFDRTDGPIRSATPTKKGRGLWPGVERVTWFELPLATVTSPEILSRTANATMRLVEGDAAPAHELIASLVL